MKKKKWARWVSEVLALSMLSLVLGGCGSSSSTSSSSSDTSETEEEDTAEEAAEEEAEEETGDTAADTAGEEETGTEETAAEDSAIISVFQDPNGNDVEIETGVQFPLEETVTLEMWYPIGSSMGDVVDLNDTYFWQDMEEKTNVHVEFIIPASGTESEAFNLLFTSDDMPDIVYSSAAALSYRGGKDMAIEDGYFIDLVDYLDYAPNYVAFIGDNEELLREAYTDTGKMYGFTGFWEEKGMADWGLSIRQDFLDLVGMDVPVTYDDWHEVLTAFKEELGISSPLFLGNTGIDYDGLFLGGYGVGPNFYQVDGEVLYGPLQDGYREYLVMMKQWYAEGLVDPDFMTRSGVRATQDETQLLNDQIGACVSWNTRLSDVYTTRGAENPDYMLVGVTNPVLNEGDETHIRGADSWTHDLNVTLNIAADSEYIEIATAWVDLFYAELIYQNANYGVEEGTSYYVVDGKRYLDYDFRYNNPDGLSSATVLMQYWARNPPVRIQASQVDYVDDVQKEAFEIWQSQDDAYVIPDTITMTTDESTEYSSLYTDIETYVEENTVNFITGATSLDEWDNFVATIESMGIDRCIEIKQAALDRYYAR